jgi:DNA-binding transcriptional LysR family regulator
MELRHLHYFVAVAEALSFTKAAKFLNLAQPSLTRQIKDLEAEIGVRLINRSGKRISLTHEGEYFLRDTKTLLAESARSVQAVQRLSRGEAGQLSIGYVANIHQNLLPLTLAAFRKTYPRISLNLFDMTPAEQYKALEEGSIDLGFVGYQPRSNAADLQSSRVSQDLVVVAVATGSPISSQIEIDLEELESLFFVGMSEKSYPGFNEWLIDLCRQSGFTPRILQDVEREPGAISFVAAGLGVALLSEQIKRLPHDGVTFVPVRQHLTVDSWAVWKGGNPSDCLKHYIQIVRESVTDGIVAVAQRRFQRASGKPSEPNV